MDIHPEIIYECININDVYLYEALKHLEEGLLRILGLADLHGRADRLALLKDLNVDVTAFCGDLHNAGSEKQARPVAESLAEMGSTVVIVPGNMDPKSFVPELWSSTGLKLIDRSSYRFGDYGFIGMGGIVPRNPKRLGDLTRYYHWDHEVYESLAKVHKDISDARFRVVLTHQPPRGACDEIYSGEITGSMSLRRFVEEYKPHLLLCGHIHEGRGEAQIGPTKVINVGELRQGYAALIDLDDKIEVEWIGPR